MRHKAVYVYIFCATARRGWRDVGRRRYNKRQLCCYQCLLLKNEQFEPWLCRHTAVVFISLFQTEGIDCRGWASLDMSFEAPMVSCCSIFIHLQVSNRPLGQHIVSQTCQLGSGQDIRSAETIWSHLLVTLPCPLLFAALFFSLSHLSTSRICDISYILVISAVLSLA